jgi:drug/metabolite transporter (DMT)-like permease
MNITTIGKIVLVMLLWAACFPLITAGIEFAPHLTFASLRAIVAGVLLIALALSLRRPLPSSARIWAMITAIGIGATSLGFLGMFHAAEFVTPGIATVIANAQPLLAAILAAVILNEKITARGVVGLILGFIGILFIALPQLVSGSENFIRGIGYIILAAIGITVGNVLIKRIAGNVDALMAMGLQMLIGSVPLAVGAWGMEVPTEIQWSLTFVGILLFLSVIGTAFVYWLWFSVLANVPLNQANVFSFLIPTFGLAAGALFFGETLGWSQLVGIALTVMGVGLVTRHGSMLKADRK